nr:hypothetical protein [Providencia rettgeri]
MANDALEADVLETLSIDTLPTRIKAAAKKFVDLKYQIDCEGRYRPDGIPDDLYGPVGSGEYSAVSGDSFFINIMPFAPFYESEGQVKYIPIEYTVGCSWRWWPEHVENDREEIIAFINNREQAEKTEYTFVENLGLVLSSEGKNRIHFCRVNKIDKIPGRVHEMKYPEADRIVVYALQPDYYSVDINAPYLAVLDGRYLQVINHFDYALPLLNAYGVKVITSWPSDFPKLTDVHRFADKSMDSTIGRRKCIDLDKIKSLIEKEAELTLELEQTKKVGITDLEINNKLPLLFLSFLLIVISSVLLALFSDTDMNLLLGALFGISLAFFFSMVAPIFIVKKKYISKKLYWR